MLRFVLCQLLGKGSTFSAQFDCGDLRGIPLVGIGGLDSTAALRGPVPRSVRRFRGQRVLVVDDGEANLTLITLVLHKANLETVITRNGQAAVDRAILGDLDMILMDMRLPVLDGYTATKFRRKRGLTTPILALTANVMRSDEEKCMEAGCDDYWSTPIDIDRLLETLAGFLEFDKMTAIDHFDPVHTANSLPTQSTEPRTATTNGHANCRQPLRSSLPLSESEVRAIVVDFQQELETRIAEIESMIQQGSWDEVAQSAHWLKGAGGTVGFKEFTTPSARLEAIARQERDPQLAAELLAEIHDLSNAIAV